MNFQLAAVLVCLGLAGCYLAHRAWLAWSGAGQGGCGKNCGCGTSEQKKSPLIPVESVSLRSRDR